LDQDALKLLVGGGKEVFIEEKVDV